MGKAFEAGTLSPEIFSQFEKKWQKTEQAFEAGKKYHLKKEELANSELGKHEKIKPGDTLDKVFAKNVPYSVLEGFGPFKHLTDEELFSVSVYSKYEGYLKQQDDQIKKFRKIENIKIKDNFDFKQVDSLKKEAVEKLNRIKPENLGQASRIQGISPSDIWNIMVYFEKQKKQKKEKRESKCSG